MGSVVRVMTEGPFGFGVRDEGVAGNAEPVRQIDALIALAWALRNNDEQRAHALASEARELAIAHGYKPGDFTALAVIGSTEGPIAPCGACRQVVLELGGNDLPVILTNLKGDMLETTAAGQLPNAFGGWDLKK